MAPTSSLAVIVNPAAANGRTGRRWPLLERALRERAPGIDVFTTTHPGHATRLAADALRGGAGRILSVGGDGTHYEVLNGFFHEGRLIDPSASLAILPEGTGSDLARSIGIAHGLSALDTAVNGRPVSVDVGRVTFHDAMGAVRESYFLNAMHAGIGGAVVASVNRTTKVFGGFASFLLGVIRTLATYGNTVLALELDATRIRARCNDILIANGRYDGGGMRIAPRAIMNDGLFDVYVIGDVSRTQAFVNLGRLYRGTLEDRPDLVQRYACRHVNIASQIAVPLGIEGEQPGTTPATIELLPAALPLVVGVNAEALRD